LRPPSDIPQFMRHGIVNRFPTPDLHYRKPQYFQQNEIISQGPNKGQIRTQENLRWPFCWPANPQAF